jgi:uncharacterized RDD family membrane protein YckC
MTQPAQVSPASGAALAGWGSRVGASIIDALPTIVVFIVLVLAFGDNDTSGSSVSFQLNGIPALVYFLFAVAWFVYNTVHRQGSTGQSVGKKALGIAIYQAGTSQPLGGGLTFARSLVHVVDAIPCFIGFLWPLWDKENRTFADMIMTSRAYRVQVRAG